jgi:hypothetical protein
LQQGSGGLIGCCAGGHHVVNQCNVLAADPISLIWRNGKRMQDGSLAFV